MATDQYLIISVLGLVLLGFIWGKWRYDVVALFALVISVVLGLVPVDDMFSGFGHPATVTVAIVLIISYGLTKAGAVEGMVQLISPLAKYPSLHVAVLIFTAAFLSMFMNNVGALALLMPIAIHSTVSAGRSPSAVLMPLSFGSILGGLVTMIGTPPNIIIAEYRRDAMGEPFTMFDFSPVGGAVALAGVLFMATIGWRFVKVRKSNAGTSLFEIESYLFEVKITKDSPFKGKTIKEFEETLDELDIGIASLIHKKEYYPVPSKRHKLAATDMLVLEGAQDDVDKLVSKYKLALFSAENARDAISMDKGAVMMEVMIAPRSPLEGKTVEQVGFKSNYGVNLLAIPKEGKTSRKRLREQILKAGDVLLLHGSEERIENAISKLQLFPLAERGIDIGKRKYAMIALGVFAAAIGCSAFGLLPVQVSLGAAAIAMVLLNIIPARELYDGVDWPVIVLLGAMIPIGGALESTGATKLLAEGILEMGQGLSIPMILTLILVITMTLSDILNNAATAILMAPIAKTIATTLGVSIDPFLMAVAIGASCAFLTPIGHQNNALVMGPGGYKFGDYWPIGVPLEMLIVAVSVPLILIVWPL